MTVYTIIYILACKNNSFTFSLHFVRLLRNLYQQFPTQYNGRNQNLYFVVLISCLVPTTLSIRF